MKCRAKRTMSTILRIASLSAALVAASCATVGVSNFKRDPEFLYGKGAGRTQKEAEDAARIDLITQAFAGAQTASTEGGGAFVFTPEMTKSVKLPTLKPFIIDKSKTEVSVVYRLPKQTWTELEKARQVGIRAEVGTAFDALRNAGNKNLEWRIAEAGRLLDRLSLEGVAGIVTETESSPTLMSRAIESYCMEQVSDARFAVEPSEGLIDDASSFEITFASKGGSPLPATPISIAWKTAGGESLGKATMTTTDSRGTATIAFPKGEGAAGARGLRLSLSTAFSPRAPEVPIFKALDAEAASDFQYFHFDDLKKAFFNEARVPAGEFMAGAVSQDRHAERKEAPRQATVASFYIDKNLVTNAMYGAFLADTGAPRSAYPAYWGNPDYNGPDQPVIGVSLEDANRFAAWVSERLGTKKRLPTEEEWEKAARGGAETIYPWGDQPPTDSARANYNGNGRFDGTSPVGSFESGKNAYGLYDMAGNVWEWTSSPSDSPDSPGAAIVKGGSWMDGPNELRVSNRRDLDPAERFSDVGFRLVREVSND
jgi:hypothetical protein